MRIPRSLPILLLFGLVSCRTTIPEYPANSPATVEGYKKVMEDQLGPIWYRLIRENLESVSVGTVKLTFEIHAAGGRAQNLRLVSNTGSHLDAVIAADAVGKLIVPPIPAGVLQASDHKYLVADESFTVFEKRPASPSPSPTPRKR